MHRVSLKQWCQQYQPRVESCGEMIYSQRPLVMGILNVTPDSFSDGGQFFNPDNAFKKAMQMIAEGADIIDVGGESSRPGAEYVSCDEELARVLPVIERIRAHSDIDISIDTCKAKVMCEAVGAGASMINDIQALTDTGALSVASNLKVPICLMHMKGTPKTMQDNPEYSEDVVDEIHTFFQQRVTMCEKKGVEEGRLILDPGIGFGKSLAHNLQILRRLGEFQQHKRPILLGLSRKSMLGEVLQQAVNTRLIGSIASAIFAVLQGVSIIRTHDVSESYQALHMLDSIMHSKKVI